MILSATLFLLGVFTYSIKELQAFGKLKWTANDFGFWGSESWRRKYKGKVSGKIPRGSFDFQDAPDNLYYRFFKIDFVERFPGSTTIFVFITDGPHLMQFFYKLLFCAAFYPLTNWWFPVVMWCLWGICFTLCDKYLSK